MFVDEVFHDFAFFLAKRDSSILALVQVASQQEVRVHHQVGLVVEQVAPEKQEHRILASYYSQKTTIVGTVEQLGHIK